MTIAEMMDRKRELGYTYETISSLEAEEIELYDRLEQAEAELARIETEEEV